MSPVESLQEKIAALLGDHDYDTVAKMIAKEATAAQRRAWLYELLRPYVADVGRKLRHTATGTGGGSSSAYRRFLDAGNDPLDVPAPFPSVIGLVRLRDMTAAMCLEVSEAYGQEAERNRAHAEAWRKLADELGDDQRTLEDLGAEHVFGVLPS